MNRPPLVDGLAWRLRRGWIVLLYVACAVTLIAALALKDTL